MTEQTNQPWPLTYVATSVVALGGFTLGYLWAGDDAPKEEYTDQPPIVVEVPRGVREMGKGK